MQPLPWWSWALSLVMWAAPGVALAEDEAPVAPAPVAAEKSGEATQGSEERPVPAAGVEALRAEIERLRREAEEARRQQEERIRALEQRLQELQRSLPPPPPATPPTVPAPSPVTTHPGFRARLRRWTRLR